LNPQECSHKALLGHDGGTGIGVIAGDHDQPRWLLGGDLETVTPEEMQRRYTASFKK
jgi:hypothetical protein